MPLSKDQMKEKREIKARTDTAQLKLSEIKEKEMIKTQVETLEVPKEEIEKELKNLKIGIKEGFLSRRNTLTKDLLSVYGHLQHGGKIIDIREAFSSSGLKEDDTPKLGIVSANSKFCYLYKLNNGGAIFSNENKGWRELYAKGTDVKLPPETFGWDNLDERRLKAVAPIIPPRINVAISARIIPDRYHILYEVESWEKSRPRAPRDPILGKMLTKNLFGVLATWDLTELERKIIAGRV